MRIGIDCRMYSSRFTGIGRYTKELVEQLLAANKAQNFPHDFVLFFNNPEFHEFQPSTHVQKVLVNARHYSFKEQTRFLRLLNKERLDLVHFPHFNIPLFYRRPYLVTIHDLTLSFFPGRKMRAFFYRLAYAITIRNAVRRAKKIIAVSHNTKKDIIEQFHVQEEKIHVIYHGVNPEFTPIKDPKLLAPTLQKFNINKDFLLYTGVWRSHKNLPNFIRAFGILKKNNLDIQLVITGRPDPYYPEVKETVHRLHLENDVIFTNLVTDSDLVHLYNAASIYVFPSLYEGFGLPPLEAMACATPVAASNISSIPEICGENAVYFNPYDPTDIANKIELLYKDPDLQAKLIRSGLQHAASFSWVGMATKTFKLF